MKPKNEETQYTATPSKPEPKLTPETAKPELKPVPVLIAKPEPTSEPKPINFEVSKPLA